MRNDDKKRTGGGVREELLSDNRPPLPLGAGPKVSVVIVPLITFLFFSLWKTHTDVMSLNGLDNRLATQLAATCGLPMGSHMGQRYEHFLSGEVGSVWVVYSLPYNRGQTRNDHPWCEVGGGNP